MRLLNQTWRTHEVGFALYIPWDGVDNGACSEYPFPCDVGGLMKIFATIRGICFYLTTFAFASPLFVVMLAVYPFVLIFDKFRYGRECVQVNTVSVESIYACLGGRVGDEGSML